MLRTRRSLVRLLANRSVSPRINQRKCMGIEPTYGAVDAPYDDFEDRGHHQVCKHFRVKRARL